MSDVSHQAGARDGALNEFLASIVGSMVQEDKDLVSIINQRTIAPEGSLYRMQVLEKLVDPLSARWKAHRWKAHGGELALIAYLEVATELLGLYVPGHPRKATTCYAYDRSLELDCYSLESDELLDSAIQLGREALALRPTGHPGRATTCAILATLLAKYAAKNGNALLREVNQLDREVLQLRPIGHPDRDEALRDLAASLTCLYLETGDTPLLEEVISLEREMVDLQPLDHPRRAASCVSLSASLGSLYEKTKDIGLTHEAVQLDREALSLLPLDHDKRYDAYTGLVGSLQIVYEDTKEEDVLGEIIQLERDALVLRPPGHSRRGSACENLTTSLGIKFNVTKDPSIIGEAIHLNRELLALRPPDHPERASTCEITAYWLMNRFDRTGDTTLLDEALKLGREALALALPDDPGRGSAAFIVAHLEEQLYQAQDSKDATLLQQAIQHGREALALLPADHLKHAEALMGLAVSLATCYNATDDPAVMIELVQLLRRAVALLDANHTSRGYACTSLAAVLISMFNADDGSRDVALLDEASTLLDEALVLHRPKHPERWKILHQCVGLAVARKDHTLALQFLKEWFDAPTINLNIMEFLYAAVKNIKSLEGFELSRSEEKALLRLHEIAINCIIFATGFALGHSAQLRRLFMGSAFGSSAFMLSTQVDELPLGLQLLERARGIIWAETLHMRNPQLDRVPDALAKKLQVLIQDNTANEAQLQETPLVAVHYRPFLPESDRLYEQRSQLQLTLQEIRSLPGLDSFMREPTSEMLQTVADRNVVVVLIEGGHGGCHALIIGSAQGPLVHIALEGIGEAGAQELTFAHSTWQQRGACADVDDEDGQRLIMRRSQRLSAASTVLAKLWRTVVKPIITHLGLEVSVIIDVLEVRAERTSRRARVAIGLESTGAQQAPSHSPPFMPQASTTARTRSAVLTMSFRHTRRL
jgi:tetratricopeptide (TPR) repeat protein